MVMALLLSWQMVALDFDNAFAQAPLDHDVYAYLPRGFKSMLEIQTGQRACLKLRKSVYGMAVAPRLWYLHLLKALKKLGFKKSSYDQCLLYNENAILITFVDDCGLAVKDPKYIDVFVSELQKLGFELHVEGDFSAFLGVAIEKRDDGTIHMHQRGLIKKVLAATKMEDCNGTHTPASTVALGPHEDDALWPNEAWSYSSIVGMLLYLSTNTRPDIAFAVSQVSRYNKQPRMAHAKALKMIIRYLKQTATMGTIVKPTGELNIVCYCDADHAGRFGSDDPRNRDSARSRGGYIISCGGIPVFWKSWLMTAICLSTLEAEYQCLSKAMTQVIGFKLLIEELVEVFDLPELKSTIRAKVFEDNQGAIFLATNQRLTSRTKYFHVKWHHFWDNVSKDEGKDGKIVVEKVSTDLQNADPLTKGLPKDPFVGGRKRNQGW